MSQRAVVAVNALITEVFSVFDANDAGVTGLVNGDFTKYLYKDGAVSAVSVTVTEISNGQYKATFTPDSAGAWHLRVTQASGSAYNKRGWQFTFTATADGVLTLAAIRADLDANSTKLANLDVAVSTRAATADSRFDHLDADVSSRAATADPRFDHLDADVSSRLSATDPALDPLSNLDVAVSTRLASDDPRLDHLDADVSSRAATADPRFDHLDADVSSRLSGTDPALDPLSNLDVAVSTRASSDEVSAIAPASEIAAAVWAYLVEGAFSAGRMLRIALAVLAGKSTGGRSSMTARDLSDSEDMLVGSADNQGNRTPTSYGG